MTNNPDTLLSDLSDAGVDFIVVGGFAAVMLGVPVLTHDVDIVHRCTEANVDVVLAWLLRHAAHNRFDLANRKLAPSRDALLGVGHLDLQLDIGPLDIFCTLDDGHGYHELLEHTVLFDREGTSLRVLDLPRLIQAKSNANRPKDRAVLPLLIATLDERNRHGAKYALMLAACGPFAEAGRRSSAEAVSRDAPQITRDAIARRKASEVESRSRACRSDLVQPPGVRGCRCSPVEDVGGAVRAW